MKKVVFAIIIAVVATFALQHGGLSLGAFGGGSDSGSVSQVTGDHAALISQALKLAGAEDSAGNRDAVNIIVVHESGWNAGAVNRTDKNALAGNPSKGLMQTTITTFNENAVPGHTDIFDPLSNLAAGIVYSTRTYGGVQNVPGVIAVRAHRQYVPY